MKESIWGYVIIAIGVVIITILLLVQRLTTINEEDYFLAREILEASMYDAIDYGTYRSTGKIVMSSEKFQEVFIRRFAKSVSGNREYQISFYDINEYPPKASVIIRTKTGESTVNSSSVDISVDTIVNGILETTD